MFDAGSINEIKPGTMKRIDTESGNRIIVCNVDGKFYACDAMCTHEDFSLHYGCLKGELVQCSLHSGMFNVKTGEAVVEPAEIALQTYDVTIDGERILVDG